MAAAAAMLWSGISNHGNSQFTGMIWIPITLHHLTLYPTSNIHFFSKCQYMQYFYNNKHLHCTHQRRGITS
jgi:hypothetical protein